MLCKELTPFGRRQARGLPRSDNLASNPFDTDGAIVSAAFPGAGWSGQPNCVHESGFRLRRRSLRRECWLSRRTRGRARKSSPEIGDLFSALPRRSTTVWP